MICHLPQDIDTDDIYVSHFNIDLLIIKSFLRTKVNNFWNKSIGDFSHAYDSGIEVWLNDIHFNNQMTHDSRAVWGVI